MNIIHYVAMKKCKEWGSFVEIKYTNYIRYFAFS